MEKACVDINQLVNVFSNSKGIIYQSDKLNCLYVDFGGKFAKFNYQSLQKLKNVVEQINIEELLLNANNANFEVVSFHGCDYIYLLNAVEIVHLKDLLHGAFTMFKLNHLINDCLYRLVV